MVFEVILVCTQRFLRNYSDSRFDLEDLVDHAKTHGGFSSGLRAAGARLNESAQYT